MSFFWVGISCICLSLLLEKKPKALRPAGLVSLTLLPEDNEVEVDARRAVLFSSLSFLALRAPTVSCGGRASNVGNMSACVVCPGVEKVGVDLSSSRDGLSGLHAGAGGDAQMQTMGFGT